MTLSRLQSCRNLCRIMAMTHQNSSLHQPNQSGSICLPDSTCSVDSAARYWSGQTSAKPCRKRDLLRKAVGPVSNCVFPTAEPQRYGIKSTKNTTRNNQKYQQENPPASSKALVVKRPLPLESSQGRISSPSGHLLCHSPMAPGHHESEFGSWSALNGMSLMV